MGRSARAKIVARVEGRTKRIFGWETEAAGEAYASFLHAFLDALIPHLKELGIDSRCRFHISDERQRIASAIIRPRSESWKSG